MSKTHSHSVLRGEPFVEVTRGDAVESIHHVAACAVDARGATTFSLGDVESAPVFLRSSAKPFIATAIVAAGAHERFGFEPREIAVIAGSHAGQPFHIEAVESILRKIGLTADALQCGPQAPYDEQAARDLERTGIEPAAIYNNCSGKHAGILALCKVLGSDTATYMSVDNPAQQAILDLCARVSGVKLEDLVLAVDGCGIPVYAVPMRNGALSFMHFATLTGLREQENSAMKIVRDAMIVFPEYVSGTNQLDALLMKAAGGSIACKGGAEGYHGTSSLPACAGLVVKVVDGSARGRAPAVLAILRRLTLLSEEQLTELGALERPVVYNRAGREVGRIRARSL